jgi:cytochrome c-type biogenesis protein CcmE
MKRQPQMTRKRRRLYFVLLGLFGLFSGMALVLGALQDNLVFFFGPSELLAKHPPPGQRMRVGGIVAVGSLAKSGQAVTFTVTDNAHDLKVRYSGLLPDLFKEGAGVVAEGHLDADGSFLASDILAKHDENYMPREVADALKKSGHWQEHGTVTNR